MNQSINQSTFISIYFVDSIYTAKTTLDTPKHIQSINIFPRQIIPPCKTYDLTPIYKTTLKSSEMKSTDPPPFPGSISCYDKQGTLQYALQCTQVYITIQLYA